MKSDMGRNKNRGSNNGRIFLSGSDPLIPIHKDMWINQNALDPIYIVKSSDTSRFSTTTLQDDPHLEVDFPPNGLFWVFFDLRYYTNASITPDIKVAWDTSGDVSAKTNRSCHGCQPGMTSLSATQIRAYERGLSSTFAYGGGNLSNVICCADERFIIETSTLGGLLTLQWAQNSSNANATTVKAGSYIQLKQIDGDVSLLKWYSGEDSEWKFMI